MAQSEDITKIKALEVFTEKVCSFVKMLPEKHRCEVASVIAFSAIMSGADGDPYTAKGIASEVVDMIREAADDYQ